MTGVVRSMSAVISMGVAVFFGSRKFEQAKIARLALAADTERAEAPKNACKTQVFIMCALVVIVLVLWACWYLLVRVSGRSTVAIEGAAPPAPKEEPKSVAPVEAGPKSVELVKAVEDANPERALLTPPASVEAVEDTNPERLRVATWNAAGSDRKYKGDPAQFFTANQNCDLILLQESGDAERVAAEALGFSVEKLGMGMRIAWKRDTMHYIQVVNLSTEIPGSGTTRRGRPARNGTAACVLFHLNNKLYKDLPLRVLNIHAGHNYDGGRTKSVNAMQKVWSWSDDGGMSSATLNIIGGDMNETHSCQAAKDLVGEGYSTEKSDKTHRVVGWPDQLGARGAEVIASITCRTGENYGSDHCCKLLEINLKHPDNFTGEAKGKYCSIA